MNVIIEEIVSEYPVTILEEVVQITISDAISYFDLLEVADTDFVGKNGYIPVVDEATGKLVLMAQQAGPGGGLTLGETSNTAYRGDRGKIAYVHSQDVTTNPHNVTKQQVGLGNVDNTSDAGKPISGATQTALDDKVDKVLGKGLSTEDYTTAEKSKLAGIETGAEVNNISDSNATDLTDGGETTLHHHDSRYYTETEVNNLLDDKFDNPTGNNTQYLDGAGVPTIFPTIPSGFGDLAFLDEVGTNEIVNHSVTNTKLAQMNATTVKGRLSGNGTPQDVPMADLPISTATQTALDDKVDKELGKSLISENEITRLASLFNNSNITAIESFGDSITFGQGSTNINFAYINLVAQFIGKSLTNRALSGSGVWASARSHIQNINPNHSVMAFVMSGFNDARRGGSNPLTRLKIINSYRSILANHFLINFVSAGATDSRIVRANGTWQTNYTGLALGMKTNTGAYSNSNGATIEFTFSGNNVVLGMVAVKQSFETHATFTIHIDNVLIGTFNNNDQTDGISDGVYDNNRTQMVRIFDNLSESMHTIRLTNTSSNFLVVDYFGQLKQPKQSLPICVAKMPKMNAAGYATAPNLANDALIDSLNVDIVSVCDEFKSKGYPIYIAETNDFYNINTGLSADNIHPNNVGYTQIYNAIVAQIGNLIV